MKNTRAIVRSFITFSACCLLGGAVGSFAQEDDSTVSEVELRKQISQQSAELLRAENFDELEKTAAEFRANKTRLPSGFWKLYNFYEGIESPHTSSTGRDWQTHLARLEKWRAQYPQSITVHTALAAAYAQFAWQARGTGYGDSVTEEGWQLFKERLHKAQEYIADARKLPATDPHLDYINLMLAKGLTWDWRQYNAVFDEAVKREPQYIYLYFQKVSYSLPRWSGKHGDVERFTDEAVRLTQADEGKVMYARLGVYLRQYVDRGLWFFDAYRLSWREMQEGFRDMEKQYPHSMWNLNQFSLMACQAKDSKTAHELFERIGDRWDADVWSNEGQYRKWKNWAEDPAAHRNDVEAAEVPFWQRLLRELLRQ